MSIDEFYRLARWVWRRGRSRWGHILEEEDAVQAAVLDCWLRSATYNAERAGELTFYTLVATSTMRQLHMRATRQKRGAGAAVASLDAMVSPVANEKADDPTAAIEQQEVEEQLRRAIELLPEHRRVVIQARYGVGMPRQKLRAVAKSEGVSPQAIKMRQDRALRDLRVSLTERLSR